MDSLIRKQTHIRQLVRERLRLLAPESDDSVEVTLLIRDGRYCGQRFSCGGFSAVWFVEEKEIKVFGPTRELLESLSVESLHDQPALGQPTRHAA